jgi:hypothetical protein
MTAAGVLIILDLTLFAISLLGAGLFLVPRLRQAIGKKLVLTSVLCVGAAVTLYFLVVPHEQVFLFNPQIDTVYATGYTDARFLQVEPGMTRAAVTRLIGQPLDSSAAGSQADEEEYKLHYSRDGACSWGDFAWKDASITMSRKGHVLYTSRAMVED